MNICTRFAHIRDAFPIGRNITASAVTIAFRDGDAPGTVDYAVSFCSNRDQFSKAKGRRIAENRLLNHDLARDRENLTAKVGNVQVSDTRYRTVVDTILRENAFLSTQYTW